MYLYCGNNPIRFSDYSGNYYVEGIFTCGVVTSTETKSVSESPNTDAGDKVAVFYDNRMQTTNTLGVDGLAKSIRLCVFSGKTVESYPFSTIPEFIDAWNRLEGVYTDLYIYIHGNSHYAILVGDGGSIGYGYESGLQNLYTYDILNKATVTNTVYLYSCYGSLPDSSGRTTAEAFADLTNCQVISSDGRIKTTILGGAWPSKGYSWTMTLP